MGNVGESDYVVYITFLFLFLFLFYLWFVFVLHYVGMRVQRRKGEDSVKDLSSFLPVTTALYG